MSTLLREGDGPEAIEVFETEELYGERGRFRALRFADGAIQGAIDLNDPARAVLEYPRAMLHLIEHRQPACEAVFLIGHGIGTMAAQLAGRRVKIAERDARIPGISEKYFGYRGTSPVIGDGRVLLEQEAPQAYDAVAVDAFTADGIPRHLVSEPFFRLAAAKLDDGGLFLMNVTGRGNQDRGVGAVFATMRQAFGHAQAFVLPSGGAGDVRNYILAGSRKPLRYRLRQMAGFVLADLPDGHVLGDSFSERKA